MKPITLGPTTTTLPEPASAGKRNRWLDIAPQLPCDGTWTAIEGWPGASQSTVTAARKAGIRLETRAGQLWARPVAVEVVEMTESVEGPDAA